jgi:hypothetical protein
VFDPTANLSPTLLGTENIFLELSLPQHCYFWGPFSALVQLKTTGLKTNPTPQLHRCTLECSLGRKKAFLLLLQIQRLVFLGQFL